MPDVLWVALNIYSGTLGLGRDNNDPIQRPTCCYRDRWKETTVKGPERARQQYRVRIVSVRNGVTETQGCHTCSSSCFKEIKRMEPRSSSTLCQVSRAGPTVVSVSISISFPATPPTVNHSCPMRLHTVSSSTSAKTELR